MRVRTAKREYFTIPVLKWVEHRHASCAAYDDLNEGAPATLGMMMPALAQPARAHDRVANFPPVKVMLGSKLLRRCVADDEPGYP